MGRSAEVKGLGVEVTLNPINPKLREESLTLSDRPRTLGRGPHSSSAHATRETERPW